MRSNGYRELSVFDKMRGTILLLVSGRDRSARPRAMGAGGRAGCLPDAIWAERPGNSGATVHGAGKPFVQVGPLGEQFPLAEHDCDVIAAT